MKDVTVAHENGVGEKYVRRVGHYAKGVDAAEKVLPGMNDDRKRLARKMDDQFFTVDVGQKKVQPPKNPEVAQLLELIQVSPDIAGPLLQMSQILGGSKAKMY